MLRSRLGNAGKQKLTRRASCERAIGRKKDFASSFLFFFSLNFGFLLTFLSSSSSRQEEVLSGERKRKRICADQVCHQLSFVQKYVKIDGAMRMQKGIERFESECKFSAMTLDLIRRKRSNLFISFSARIKGKRRRIFLRTLITIIRSSISRIV